MSAAAGHRGPFRIYGMHQSYFTRKLTGYLDYKGLPWRYRRIPASASEPQAAGWPGGIPALRTPDEEYMWDSSAVIHYLEQVSPEPSVLPADAVARFLCYVIEDVSDEWLYRPAVGTRWNFEENTQVGGWDLARDMTVGLPLSCDQGREMAAAHVRASCPPLGVTPENIASWVDEVLRPWQRAAGALLEQRPYLFGGRPSLADFALFGGNAAHFANDPVCRRWTEADAPAVVRHTHRLLQPEDETFGAWSDPDDVPAALIALLADLGRLYLPWVARATVDGAAELAFASGEHIEIAATDFLKEARGVLLARYVALRCDPLDAVLERAGILGAYADHVGEASAVPTWDKPPRPALNRPFAVPGS